MKKLLTLLLAFIIILSGCSTQKTTVNVQVEIDCSDILSNYDKLDENLKSEKYVPTNGMILNKTTVEVNEGNGAIDVLKAVAKEMNIAIDVSDGYAKGINNIYEKSCGETSGWVYEVNNEPVMTEYVVSEGDLITWKYVCDFLSFFE